jgi:thioredoxin-like negative regulator of GroEL
MTSIHVLDQRQAQAVQQTIELLEELPTTERFVETKSEPLLPPGYATTIIAAELAHIVTRHEAAFNHLVEHVVASQDAEIGRLRERVAQLEEALAEKSGAKKLGSATK